MFWSSAVLTGNRTNPDLDVPAILFWSSAVLTGNRTHPHGWRPERCFGAVPF